MGLACRSKVGFSTLSGGLLLNVIITGGYGFIGSFVSERFYKEGHQIYIIDNLTTGQKSNVTVPHQFYRMSVHDLNCEQLFQSISPDVVIHLAAQVDVVTSVNEPHADTQSNILGLVNILRCSHKTKVKKLIFASSAAVYGPYEKISLKEDMVCGPVSPYGINKYLGEYYCEKWKELYGLKTLCFRFSNVYGPGRAAKAKAESCPFSWNGFGMAKSSTYTATEARLETSSMSKT